MLNKSTQTVHFMKNNFGDPRLSPARLVEELNRRPTSKIRESKRRLEHQGRQVLFGALLSATALVGSSWLAWSEAAGFLALTLPAFCATAVLSQLARRKYATAELLQVLDEVELGRIRELGNRSDVVRELLHMAASMRRELYRADLVYARAIVVRENRNGDLPSDRLPLEQTRGLLLP